jgi:hypothetical protein
MIPTHKAIDSSTWDAGPSFGPSGTNGGHMPEGARDEEHDHEGSFAEGQEQAEHHPEAEHEGDFAEGQERRGNAERDPGVAPADDGVNGGTSPLD